MDQAAAAFHALTSGRRTDVIVGPAGTGKTFTVAAIARAWQQNPGKRHRGRQLAGRDRRADQGRGRGLAEQHAVPGQDQSGSVRLDPHTLVIHDEASTESMRHLAKIHDMAEQHNAKVLIAGDPGQLQAVEQGGGMRLLADSNGYSQLSVPVRFESMGPRQAVPPVRPDWAGRRSGTGMPDGPAPPLLSALET